MNEKKYFVITIDTEGDNLWDWRMGDNIDTKNVFFLNRFQELCEKYSFKSVWLTNWEMINNPKYVEFAKDVVERKSGEIGMHLHAWNNPPLYDLPVAKNNLGAPYLIEYPNKIIIEKIRFLTDKIEKEIGIRPTSHRAGRWATNEFYFETLRSFGYTVDCSITPYINWANKLGQSINSHGTNYSKVRQKDVYWLDENHTLLEVPMTIIKSHKLFNSDKKNNIRSMASSLYHYILGSELWLRPNDKNLNEMEYVVRNAIAEKRNYIMFMLHSSELMPGGSPTFKTKESIENLYSNLDSLFKNIHNNFVGITLKDLYKKIKEKEC